MKKLMMFLILALASLGLSASATLSSPALTYSLSPLSTVSDNDSDFDKWPQKIFVENTTSFQLAVTIHYQDLDGAWITEYKVINPGRNRSFGKTGNRVVYYYAVDTHGLGWQINGSDAFQPNYYSTLVGMREIEFSRNDWASITLY